MPLWKWMKPAWRFSSRGRRLPSLAAQLSARGDQPGDETLCGTQASLCTETPTSLLRALTPCPSFFLAQTPDEGAWTSVYAAVSPALEGVGGRYLYNEKEAKSLAITYDPKLQRQLWARSCQMTGIADMTQDTLWG